MKTNRRSRGRRGSYSLAQGKQPFALCFPPATEIAEHSPGRFEVNTPGSHILVDNIGPGMAAALRKMASDGASEPDLAGLVLEADGHDALPRFYFYLLEFSEQRLLCHRVCSNGTALATSVPISPAYRFDPPRAQSERRYVLSRFAYCRRVNSQLILESPVSHAQVVLHDWRGAALVCELARPRRHPQLSENVPGVSPEAALLFLELLSNAALLSEVDDDGQVMEEVNTALLQWEFHDLLFHSRSRAGRHANPYGGTNHLAGKVEPPPAVKPKMSPEVFDLHRPDISGLRQTDITFTRALEERRSEREHGEKAMTESELGDFLYRSARIRKVFTIDGYEFTERVYPGGGAAYEIELYLAIDKCEKIPPGLYHYDPLDHQLCRLSPRTSAVERLLKSAAQTAHASTPQVLIILAARFQRMTWRYESISYAMILKDVGVLYQTMYLVATAMGLSACALGGGNSDTFAEATGTDYYTETSVGEFILGACGGLS
jgi:SagB-type dehydrogenase family enzyme